MAVSAILFLNLLSCFLRFEIMVDDHFWRWFCFSVPKYVKQGEEAFSAVFYYHKILLGILFPVTGFWDSDSACKTVLENRMLCQKYPNKEIFVVYIFHFSEGSDFCGLYFPVLPKTEIFMVYFFPFRSVGWSVSTEFSGRGFKSHSGQLSIATLKNPSVMNTIYIYIYCVKRE